MHSVKLINFIHRQCNGVDAGEVGLVGATAVVVNLARVVGNIQVASSRHKYRDDVGERQCGHNSIGLRVNHM